LEDLDGFREMFSGLFSATPAFEPLGAGRAVHGELPSLAVSAIRFDGVLEPVRCLAQVIVSEAEQGVAHFLWEHLIRASESLNPAAPNESVNSGHRGHTRLNNI
jgi:hypothetical protein